MRSFSASGSAATTALWVHQDLADNGSNSISSVLKLKRVEHNGSKTTTEGRRERKKEAASSVEVKDIAGALLSAGYSDVTVPMKRTMKESSSAKCFAIPKVVLCQQQEQHSKMSLSLPVTTHHSTYYETTNYRQSHQEIDQAAGLLLSLSSAAT